jgi:hypothetical protein
MDVKRCESREAWLELIDRAVLTQELGVIDEIMVSLDHALEGIKPHR